MCIDHYLMYNNRKIHQHQKEGVYLLQIYFITGYIKQHNYSTSFFPTTSLCKVRAGLKRKTYGIELKFPLEELYEEVNPGNYGEEYLDVHNGMTIIEIAQYSIELSQYLLSEHCAWPSGFINLYTDIFCIKAFQKNLC